MQAQEQLRRDRALLETYASEDEIESSRDRTLGAGASASKEGARRSLSRVRRA